MRLITVILVTIAVAGCARSAKEPASVSEAQDAGAPATAAAGPPVASGSPVATDGSAPAAAASLPPELETYLDEALDLMATKSIYREDVDWSEVRSLAFKGAAEAKTTSDLYPTLRMAVGATGDRHGYVMPPAKAEAYFEASEEPLPDIKNELIQERLAYVPVPTFSNGDRATVGRFAARLQDVIRDLDSSDPCAWLVDLRYNEGGNGAAMLGGIAPLLGDGTYAYHAYPDGHRTEWRMDDGTLYLADVPVLELADPPYQLRRPGAPVAVLVNEATTSAGELVAIAFRGRPDARSFGWPTLGRTTAPEGFPLSDGAMLGFSVARFADRTGQVYTDKFMPDQRFVTHDSPTYRTREVPQQAIDWLLGQAACATP